MSSLPRGDVITLVRRDEVVGLIGRELTRFEWTRAKRMINGNKEIWACLDGTLMEIVDEIGKERI